MRDEIDSTRKISPLRMAEDAILLDNSHLTMEAQLQFALEKAEEKIQQL
jgi:cytidylate kinase